MRSGICNLQFSKLLFHRDQTYSIHGIEIRGSAEFQERSGMRAQPTRAIFTVGAPTWQHSVLWYAGAIAHDAYHVKLYRVARLARPPAQPRAEDWTGATAEKACLGFQRGVLAALDAAPSMLAYVDSQLRNPVYQGRNQGRGSWLDYHQRWW